MRNSFSPEPYQDANSRSQKIFAYLFVPPSISIDIELTSRRTNHEHHYRSTSNRYHDLEH